MTLRRVSRRAAIDVGTNSVRLLVADVPEAHSIQRSFRPILRRLVITRLGEGLNDSGAIQSAAAARTAAAVQELVSLAASRGVPEPVIVGTYALRAARNPEELLRRLGRPVRVLTGKEEAALGFQGILAGLGISGPAFRIVAVDIGGGSVELTDGTANGLRETHSLSLGCVVLTQRFLAHDPPLASEVEALRDFVAESEAPVLAPLRRRRFRFVGVGGTITTAAALAQRLVPYDPDRVHGYRLSAAALRRLTGRLLAVPLVERRRMPGLQPERADVIGAGVLVLEHLMVELGRRTLVVSESDLLWALLLGPSPAGRQ